MSELKTPYYVIHKEELENSLSSLKSALNATWDNYLIGYSYKTNSLPWVVDYFNKNGCSAEVVSEDEYRLADLIGVDKSNRVYNGPIKTKETFTEALLNKCYVNIDSKREIEWLKDIPLGEYNLGIRVNFDLEKYCPRESQCGSEGGRFGFSYENGELKKAIDKISEYGFRVVGLHLHTSSKTRSVGIYRAISKVACEIVQRYNLELSFLDVGGGYFGGLENKPKFIDYLTAIKEELADCFTPNKTKLIVEPGMALIGSPISYVTSVIDVKDTPYNRFVITDGTRTSIDPLMTKKSYFCKLECSANEKHPKQIICGSTCMEHDRLFECENEPTLNIADRIIYNKVGAYTICLTPLFISYFPDVYVEDENGFHNVRGAWTANEYIQKSDYGTDN